MVSVWSLIYFDGCDAVALGRSRLRWWVSRTALRAGDFEVVHVRALGTGFDQHWF